MGASRSDAQKGRPGIRAPGLTRLMIGNAKTKQVRGPSSIAAICQQWSIWEGRGKDTLTFDAHFELALSQVQELLTLK